MGTNGNTLPSDNPGLQLAGPKDMHLRFSGPPKSLSGTIPLINPTSEKQKIRSIAVTSEKLLGIANQPLREIPFHARLRGGEQLNVPVRLALHSQTPPGSYDLELTIGHRKLPATVHVTEVVDLRIQPHAITILAGSHTSYTRKLIFENAGNVPLPTGAQCECPLFEQEDLVSSGLIGLHKADKATAESLLKGLLDEWSELAVGTLLINRQAIILRPGQRVEMDVEFQLPPELKPHRRYQASLQLYGNACRRTGDPTQHRQD